MVGLHFSADINIIGVNPYVLVTAEQAQELKPGWKKPMPVLVQVNGLPNPAWKINMMPVGDGNFYLYLHGDVRKASNTNVGDTVTIDVQFNEDYKSGPADHMPDWFAEALDNYPVAKKSWDELPPSRQKEMARYLGGLKSEEAKQRNLDKALRMLSGESGRFMARDWKDGK
jgi:hypothetical protein